MSNGISQGDNHEEGGRHDPFPAGFLASNSLQLLKLMFSPARVSAGPWNDTFARLEDEPPEQAVYQLLPLFAGQWKKLHVDTNIPTKLAGVRRKSWYNHQKAERAFSKILKTLRQADIRTLILGDMAAALSHYNDPFDRPVHEFSILLDSNQAVKAIKLLGADGWEPLFELPEVNWEYLPGLRFAKDGEHQLDLRWHALSQCCFPGADTDFWSRARPLACGELSSLALDPTSTLLHLTSELCLSNPGRAVLLLADTLVMLQTAGESVDWQRLLNESRQKHLLLPLKTLFRYLTEHFEIEIPPDFLQKLAETPVDTLERLEARYPRADADRRLPGLLPVLYFDYRRQRDHRTEQDGVHGFGDYLVQYWQRGSRGALVATIWRLAWRRLKKALTRHAPAHTGPEAANDH
ncbi:nucleotidyltransferase family protein [Pseudomonadota bacterium]